MNADVHRPFARVGQLARIWQPRGLDWLLQPHDVVPRPAPSPAHSPSQAPSQSPVQQTRTRETRVNAPTPPRSTTSAPRPAHPGGPTSMARPVARELPRVWAERLAATRRGLIVWTYAQLGQDLLGIQGAGLDARRAFLGKLLRDLNHPAGTHTFWPVSLPVEQGDDAPCLPNPEAFWTGISRLGARAVVAMGDVAAQSLGLPKPLGCMQQPIRYCGVQVLSVWDVSDLLTEEAKYTFMLDFVRSYLRLVVEQAYR